MSRPVNLDALHHDLERDEGRRHKPYRDSVGKLTVGVGRNLDDIGLADDEVDHLLDNDIARAIRGLDRAIPWWRQVPGEARRRALVNMAFNIGIPRLMSFKKMLAALRRGAWTEAKAEALDSKWARQVGARAQRIAKAIEHDEPKERES